MLSLNKRLNAAPAMRCSSHALLQPCAAPAIQGQGLPDIHRNNMGPRAIGPSDIDPSDIEFGDTGFGDIGSCNTRPGDIDQPTQRLDALRLVVRDLSEQLAQTYLPPEAHATAWQRLRAGGR